MGLNESVALSFTVQKLMRINSDSKNLMRGSVALNLYGFKYVVIFSKCD